MVLGPTAWSESEHQQRVGFFCRAPSERPRSLTGGMQEEGVPGFDSLQGPLLLISGSVLAVVRILGLHESRRPIPGNRGDFL